MFFSFIQQNSLLQETSEEWEQCEKKLKDVRSWIEKTKQLLESQQQKKKPLRDQLGLCEKTLADVAIQKTKITLSVEKLQVRRVVLIFFLFDGFFDLYMLRIK